MRAPDGRARMATVGPALRREGSLMLRVEGGGARIAGGFVRVHVASLLHAWHACRAKPLGIGDFRAWLAAHEMVARRARRPGVTPCYEPAELARLLGITPRRARASIRRLVAAGLLTWAADSITFPAPLPGVSGETPRLDAIGGGRGDLAIPRRMLRHLAAGGGPALVATALAAVLRCLARRRSGWSGRGRLKAAWVASTFGVSARRAKAARGELAALGWIRADRDGPAWATGRWGPAYAIDLEWAGAPPAGPGPRSSPRATPDRPAIVTPRIDQEPPPGRERNQEPLAAGARTGIHPGRAVEAGQGGHADPVRGRGRPTGGGSVDPAREPGPGGEPRLEDVRPEDLADVGRCLDLHRQAVSGGNADASEAGQLRFVALAEHARSFRARNPGGLFVALLRRGAWGFATAAEEDRARRRLAAHRRGQGGAPGAIAVGQGGSGGSRPDPGPRLLADLLARFRPPA